MTGDLNADLNVGQLNERRCFTLDAFGREVHLLLSGTQRDLVADYVAHTWQWCHVREIVPSETSPSDAPSIGVVLDPDPAVVESAWAEGAVAGTSLEEIVGVLASAITQRAIESARGDLVMVHAAGLADPETGRTAMLVGPSGAGKSHASRVLGQTLGYVSDETVALTSSAAVLAYPKPLSLFPKGQSAGKRQWAPADLGLIEPPRDMQLSAVVVLDRRSDTPGPAVVRHLTVLEATVTIAEHISFLGALDRPLLRIGDVLRSASSIVAVTYSDAADLIPIVTDLVRATATVPAPRPDVAPSLAQLPDQLVEPHGRTVARLPLRDFVTDSDGAVALTTDGTIAAISPLASRVMTLIGQRPTTLAPVAQALVAEFGEPPESELDHQALRLTDDIVAELIASGLLTQVPEAE